MQVKTENKPLVSICTPVYNGEQYLRRYIDSALWQTLENIEIILVDNWSTDSTASIIQEYVDAYPGKIFFYKTDRHYPSAGAGRNVAIQHARADYVYCGDADDIIVANALEKLYSVAYETNSDIVCGWANIIFENEDGSTRLHRLAKKTATERVNNEKAIESGCEFWIRLIKKSLMESVGPVPQEWVFDDVAYMPVLQSHAKKITFLDHPVYYNFRRSDNTSRVPTLEVSKTSILAEQYALSHCNPKYIKSVEKYVVGRTNSNLNARWQYFGLYVQWAKAQMEWLPYNDLVARDKKSYDKITWAAGLARGTVTPNRVIINGFNNQLTDERIEEVRAKVFYDSCDVIILDETTCDVNTNTCVRAAYEQGNTEFVAGFFAVKEIYERGGIFIHQDINILNYFSYCTFQNAFFTLIDKTTYSDMVFGAPAKSTVFADILATYTEDKQDISLAQRIKLILTVKYEIPLDGKARLFQSPVSVIPPELCAVDTRFGDGTKKVICEHDFSKRAAEEEYVTLKRSTLEFLLETPRGSATETIKAQQWDKLTHSNVYKFVLFWKKIGDGRYGPFLKKVYYRLLKLKAALKHKK